MKKILYTLIIMLLPLLSTSQTTWNGSTDNDWQTSANWSSGIPTGGDNVTIPNSLSNYPIIDDGVTVALTNNLTIESTANIIIAPTGRLTVSGTLTNNAGTSGIVIQSDATGTGSLIHSTISVNGTFNLFLSGTQWHYISTPIAGVDYSEFNTLNFNSWDATTEWAGGINTDPWGSFTGTLDTAQGYANYETENTTTLTGEFFQGASNIPVYMSTGTVQNQGWNLVGNPYPSAIDWTQTDNASANLDNALYFYDGTQYASWVSGVGTLGGTQYIPPGQGFFVKCNNTSGGTLTFNNDDRVHNSQDFWKEQKPTSGLLKLISQGNGFYDETLIRFIEGATDEYDGSYDAYKIVSANPDVPQIYSLNNSKTTTFSINSLPEITEEITIPLGFLVGPAGTYSISPSEMSIDAEFIYLEDLVEANVIDLVKYPTYIFDFPGGAANDNRFLLRIIPKTIDIDDITVSEFNLYPNPSNGSVTLDIKSPKEETIGIDIYNMNGQKLFSHYMNSDKIKEVLDLSHLAAGIYHVKVTSGDETAFKKLILIK